MRNLLRRLGIAVLIQTYDERSVKSPCEIQVDVPRVGPDDIHKHVLILLIVFKLEEDGQPKCWATAAVNVAVEDIV